MSAAGDIARHVTITGRVQGVGFRWWVRNRAAALAVGGWVRNRRDGSVEAVFVGPRTAVTTMIKACHEGPAAARVMQIRTEPASADMLASGSRSELVSRPTV